MLGHAKRVLMIGAHPDDEDTELLTLLVRGMGAEAGYLSLNRGEGGQNLIGPELGDALGLLRSEELLAARRLDGARQFFTRAYDFGFSKTLDDTWAHWPRDSVLKDVVRIIRRFRPQIVVSIFSGTPRDGHGHHQAAGWAAQEAFRVAGDSTVFPELEREEGLAPFTPLKLYRSTRFDSAATTLTLNGGVVDPAVGLSYHQIAMSGRSLHRSQNMGQLQGIGPSAVRLELLVDRTGRGSDGLWAGVDTTLTGLGRSVDTAAAGVAAAEVASARALIALAPDSAAVLLESAASRVAMWGGNYDSTARQAPRSRIEVLDQLRHFSTAIVDAEGLVFDAYADRDELVGGDSVGVTLLAWNTGARPRSVRMGLSSRIGLARGVAVTDTTVPPGALVTHRVVVRLPAGVSLRRPYFTLESPESSMYRWPAPPASPEEGQLGDPFFPDPLRAWLEVDAGNAWSPRIERSVVSRVNDQARGEIRRPLVIAPRVDVKLEPAMELWRREDRGPHQLTVTLTHEARDTTDGTVAIDVPAGWAPMHAARFHLTRAGERKVFTFAVALPAQPSDSAEFRAVAVDTRGERFGDGLFTVEYSHIRPRTYQRPAVARVRIAPVSLPLHRRIAYLRGAADRIPEALVGFGLPVQLITGRDLATRSLADFDVIVIGPRAFETDTALLLNNDRLLAYARAGGTVVTQYQQYGYFLGNYPPFPMTIGSRAPGVAGANAPTTRASARAVASTALLGGHDRVTDETAPVAIVDSASPVLRTPNRITAADWEGWVQERGLYFAHSWAPAWHPVLEMHDPGDPPLQGGLLVARVGQGTYVYTGLSFFRQLPAAVPGAYRLFLNLLALGRSPRKGGS